MEANTDYVLRQKTYTAQEKNGERISTFPVHEKLLKL